jgi:hypothetical protein
MPIDGMSAGTYNYDIYNISRLTEPVEKLRCSSIVDDVKAERAQDEIAHASPPKTAPASLV